MRKQFILLSILSISVGINAQEIYDAESLKAKFAQENKEIDRQFEIYWAQNQAQNKDESQKKEIRSKVSFFFDGQPYFLQSQDTNQINNGNVDFLHQGNITALPQAINGNDITIHVFDGGRVYAGHADFGGTATNPSSRITNMEDINISYSSHATNVTGIMGASGHNVSSTSVIFPNGNTKGMAPLANFVAYAFASTVLPGNTDQSNVFQKILASNPTLSNHSYGVNSGWSYQTASITFPSTGWYYQGSYNPTTQVNMDLQGAYFTNDRNYDTLVRNNPDMVIVKSAGNYFNMGPMGSTLPAHYRNSSDQWVAFSNGSLLPFNNCGDGYDCIGPGSLAKNIITVGSTEKILTNNGRYVQASDVIKASYSSAGPRDDGGIKPDIAGVGSNIFSPSTSTTGSNSYSFGNGTSFSAPQVTGIIGLWNEIHKNFFNNTLLNAAKAKTLLIHSAAEAGTTPGPDAWYGWGFVDAKKGAELLVAKSNGTILFDEFNLANNGLYTHNIQASNNGPLKITISWVDPPYTTFGTTFAQIHNNRNSTLINDLDLKVIDETDNTIHLPWRLNINNLDAGAEKGNNTVDNVEQVFIDNAIAGRTYRIEVNHKGTLQNNSPQTFAILAEGTGALLNTNESSLDKAISLYPTLATDIVNVLTPNKAKISLYDSTGKLLQKTEGNGATAIHIESLSKGVYLVTIETEKTKTTKKFIKN